MRILLISDIHANWAALRAIPEPFDVCLFLGDLVDYGPMPAPCIDWVRQHAHHAIRGNHDHGAAQFVSVSAQSGFKYLTAVTRPLTCATLTETDRRFLAALPVTRLVSLAGRRFLLVHATPRDPLDEFGPPEREFWARRLEDVEADIVCVGHTHIQFQMDVGDKQVINPGSVGLPRDGDPRGGYAIIEDERVRFRRFEYDIAETVAAVEASPLPDGAKEQLIQVYRQGRLTGR